MHKCKCRKYDNQIEWQIYWHCDCDCPAATACVFTLVMYSNYFKNITVPWFRYWEPLFHVWLIFGLFLIQIEGMTGRWLMPRCCDVPPLDPHVSLCIKTKAQVNHLKVNICMSHVRNLPACRINDFDLSANSWKMMGSYTCNCFLTLSLRVIDDQHEIISFSLKLFFLLCKC